MLRKFVLYKCKINIAIIAIHSHFYITNKLFYKFLKYITMILVVQIWDTWPQLPTM